MTDITFDYRFAFPEGTFALSGSAIDELKRLGLDGLWDEIQLRAPISDPSFMGIVSLLGGQLSFPPTQNPSSNANTLDDYEEGLWTPRITFGNNDVGVTYTSRNGSYVKIGRLVSAAGFMTLSSKGTSVGQIRIADLPFTTLNVSYNGTIGWFNNFTGLTGSLLIRSTASSTVIPMWQDSATGASSVTNANATDTLSVYFAIVYEVA